MATFQELCSEALQGFGIEIAPNDIPDQAAAEAEIINIREWINGLDGRTRNILWYAGGELANGMWNNGFFQQWQALYGVCQADPSDGLLNTIANILTCVQHAHAQAADQPAGLAGDGQGVDSIPNAAGNDEGSESESEQYQ